MLAACWVLVLFFRIITGGRWCARGRRLWMDASKKTRWLQRMERDKSESFLSTGATRAWGEGLPMFICMWVVLCLFRFIFWERNFEAKTHHWKIQSRTSCDKPPHLWFQQGFWGRQTWNYSTAWWIPIVLRLGIFQGSDLQRINLEETNSHLDPVFLL